MMVGSLVLFGLISRQRMGVALYPEVDFPNVSITTTLQGASPEVIETELTDPIEDEISSVEGIKHISSANMQGFSQVKVEFDPLLGEQKGPEPEYVFGGRNRMDLTSDDYIRTCRDKRFRYIHNFTPQVPYAQTIPYMEKSPILQEWRRLNAAGELAGPQKLWFAPHTPDEELYDTAADPDEVNNLAGKPEHAATLKRMRAALDRWMTSIHDLGGVPEEQMIERFWPGHKQPVTATPVIQTASDGTVTITGPEVLRPRLPSATGWPDGGGAPPL